jgi:hypothetical protein
MGPRIDQIPNGFCLENIQLSIQYRSAREFSGKRLPGTR